MRVVFCRQELLKHVLDLAYNVHWSIYLLQQLEGGKMPQEKYMDYANRVKFTLEELLRDSFEEERRKLEVAYGKWFIYQKQSIIIAYQL